MKVSILPVIATVGNKVIRILNYRITILQELDLSHKEKERLNSELLLKSDLETVVHQLEQEKQRLSKKLQSFAVTGKTLFLLAGELWCVC
jgi:centrosomal protein CEP135